MPGNVYLTGAKSVKRRNGYFKITTLDGRTIMIPVSYSREQVQTVYNNFYWKIGDSAGKEVNHAR